MCKDNDNTLFNFVLCLFVCFVGVVSSECMISHKRAFNMDSYVLDDNERQQPLRKRRKLRVVTNSYSIQSTHKSDKNNINNNTNDTNKHKQQQDSLSNRYVLTITTFCVHVLSVLSFARMHCVGFDVLFCDVSFDLFDLF